MAEYEVNIPGQGTYTVNSPRDLTDDEAIAAVRNQLGQAAAPTAAPDTFGKTGFYEQAFGGADTPDAGVLQSFAGVTGRRVGSALDAAIGIPSAGLDLITGGRDGRLDAALRLLQGAASPFSAVLAPVEAAGEVAARGITGSEPVGRLAGDITGLGATLGLGALSKAGKLGETGEAFAKFFGVGKARQFEEQLARDPQLRYTTELPEIDPSGATVLEKYARSGATMEELALQLNKPDIAAIGLKNKEYDNYTWQEMAKAGIVKGEMPPEPIVKAGQVVFDSGTKRDMGYFRTLGTPATQAAILDPEFGGKVAYEINRVEMSLKNTLANREARNVLGTSGLTGAEMWKGVMARKTMGTVEDVLNASEKAIPQNVKDFVKFMDDRAKVDAKIAIPRLRDDYRDTFARQVRKEMGDAATEAEMVAEVNRRVLKAVPDNIPNDAVWMQMFPGNYALLDQNKNIVGVFDMPTGWKSKIYEIQKAGVDTSNYSVKVQSYLDAPVLNRFKGRVKQTTNQLVSALTPTEEEVRAAARGDMSAARVVDMLNPFKDKGNLKNYKEDFLNMLNIQDRSLSRWLEVRDLMDTIKPWLKEMRGRGLNTLANELEANAKVLWGHRMPGSAFLDNTVSSTPVLNNIAAPQMLERWTQAGKTFLVNALLTFNPRFQLVNSTQLAQTLWPIADLSEIMAGIKLRSSEIGNALLDKHIRNLGSKIEGWAKGLGPTERFNQETAFLTMYTRARQFGLSDFRAAEYGKQRGNLFSQFVGLTTDVPIAFRKLDPMGIFTMFRRFNVKQAEMAIDLMKHHDFPGMAKWLGVNLALGGFKSATMGQAGWLTYKTYKEIEDYYGKPVADLFHTGLPSLVGSDVSSSTQLFDPPFGENWKEKLTNFAQGPFVGLASSAIGAAMNNAAVDPSASSRTIRALASRNPLTKALWQVFGEDDKYNFRDPEGRLRYKGDMADLIKTGLGLHPAGGTMGVTQGPTQMKQAELDTFVDAFMEMNIKREEVLDYVASRYGQGQAAGIDLGKDMEKVIMKQVDGWNSMWPEFPITGTDITKRAAGRVQSIQQGMADRMKKNLPPVIRNSPVFAPSAQPAVPLPPGRGPFDVLGEGGG